MPLEHVCPQVAAPMPSRHGAFSCVGVNSPMDGSVLVTAAEFSRLLGGTVSAATVRSWRHRGLITSAGRRGNYTLYRVGDLFEVECDTRLTIERRGGAPRKAA
jgi:hypothetical protein